MSESLSVLVEKDINGCSQNVAPKPKSKWKNDHDLWRKRDLSIKEYLYIWADRIHCNVRMGDHQCLLIILGATASGKKELLADEGGFREDKHSWKEILLSLQCRGLTSFPKLAVGDGALAFCSTVGEIFPETKWQRCSVPKTTNILSKLPK
ncbi:MAG: transposase [Proteobacteria bacterium]|nr:transposase [Pseudomonadota bacterium]